MERLTVNNLNKVCYDAWELCGMDMHCTKGTHEEGGCAKGCHIIKMYKKLAEYEDAEEQGLLLRLPCKVGGTVYSFAYGEVFSAEVVKVAYSCEAENYGVFIRGKIEILGKTVGIATIDFSDIGKLYFLTKEEAEQALQKGGAE